MGGKVHPGDENEALIRYDVGRVPHADEAEELQERAAVGPARLLRGRLVDEGGGRSRVEPPLGEFPAAADSGGSRLRWAKLRASQDGLWRARSGKSCLTGLE